MTRTGSSLLPGIGKRDFLAWNIFSALAAIAHARESLLVEVFFFSWPPFYSHTHIHGTIDNSSFMGFFTLITTLR